MTLDEFYEGPLAATDCPPLDLRDLLDLVPVNGFVDVGGRRLTVIYKEDVLAMIPHTCRGCGAAVPDGHIPKDWCRSCVLHAPRDLMDKP